MKWVYLITTNLLLCLCSFASYATERSKGIEQNDRTVTCYISGSNEPIIGANIVIKGTNTGTITDVNGKAILQNVNPNATLIVSYIGYVTQEIQVKGKHVLSIILKEDTQNLDEIVVVGYGTQKRRI